MELQCDLCNNSFTTMPIAKNFPCGHKFCHKCDFGDELQRCYTCQQNLKFSCGAPYPHTHSSSLQHSPAPPNNTPQPLTSPGIELRHDTPKLNTNASTATRRAQNSDAIYEIVHNRQPPEFEEKEGEEDSRTAHGPCLRSTRQEETHSQNRDSPDPLRNIRSPPSYSEAHHPTVHKSPRSRGNPPYPPHVKTKDLYLTQDLRPMEPSPSPSRPNEPSPSPSRPREPSPSPSRPRELSPSPSRPRKPSSSPSRPREPSPSPSRPREPSPSPSRTKESSSPSSRTREPFSFCKDLCPSPSRTRSVSPPPPRARAHSPSHHSSRHTSSTCSGQQGQGVGGKGHHTGHQQPLIKPPLGTGTRIHRSSSTPGRVRQGVPVGGIASVHQHQQQNSASHTPSASLMAAQNQRLKEEEEEEEEINVDLLLMKLFGLSQELWKELLASKEGRLKVREYCEQLGEWSERLQEELKILREEEGRLQEEVMQLREKEGNMQEELKLGEEKKGRMQEELKLGEEKKGRMQEELIQLQHKYKHQEEEILHLKEENRHLQQKTVDEEDLAQQSLKEIASLSVDVGALKQQNIKQEEELRRVKQNKDKQEEEKAWLRKESSKQQREIALLEARGKKLQAELAHLREYYSNKQQEVMKVPQEQASLQEHVTTLEQKNAKLEEVVTSLKEDKARQEEKVTSLKEEKARQEEEVVYLREECARQQQQVAKEKDKNLRTKKEMTLLLDNYNKWQEKMEQIKTKEMHNQHEMEQLKKINNSLEKELQLVKEDKARQQVVVTQLKKENEHQQEEKAKYQEVVNHLRISEQDMMAAWWEEEKQRHQIKRQEEEISHLKGKGVQNQEEIDKLKREKDTEREQIKELRRERDECQVEIQTLRENGAVQQVVMEDFVKEMESSQEELHRLKRKEAMLELAAAQLRSEMHSYKEEIHQFRENETIHEEVIEKFKKKIESSQEEIDGLKKKEAMLELAAAQLRSEMHSYKEEIHQFRENEAIHEEVIEKFKKKIEGSQEEIDELRRKEMEAREELNKLKNAVARQEEKIKQVEEERDGYLEGLEKQAITQRKDIAVLGEVVVTHGLPNLGNSCYINSVVQCLYHLPPLRACLSEYAGNPKQGVKHHESKVAIALNQLFVTMKTGRDIRCAAQSLKDVLGFRDQTFRGIKQQEAHDLLSSLLLWLDDDLSKGNKPSPISSLFQGQMKSMMTCRQQGLIITSTIETFTSLSLPVVKQSKWTLENLLSRHFKSQTLEWDCQHCSSTHKCTHSTHLLECPPVLIIHLNRYQEDSYSTRKECVMIPFEGLSLQRYMAPDAPTSPKYQLASVVCHEGTQRSGHYLAYCRSGGRSKGGRWKLCNDNWVTGAGKELNDLYGAHLLFYLKQEE